MSTLSSIPNPGSGDGAPNNSFCDGDGEYETDLSLNNRAGVYDIYYKMPQQRMHAGTDKI